MRNWRGYAMNGLAQQTSEKPGRCWMNSPENRKLLFNANQF